MRRRCGQHLFFAVNQIAGTKCGNFKTMSMGDGIGRASFYAVSAENAPVVINVVDLGVALGAAYPVLLSVFGGFDVDAVRRTGRRTKETSYALLQAIFIALQNVNSPIALLKLGAF